MKKDLMSYCGDGVLDAADKYWKNAKKQAVLRRLTVIGVAALLGAGIVAAALLTAAKINGLIPKPSNGTSASPYDPDAPDFKDPVFTAAEIGALFDEQKLEGALTNAYVKIAVPSEDELKYRCMPVPQSDTVGIYKIHTENVNKAENDPFTMEQFW